MKARADRLVWGAALAAFAWVFAAGAATADAEFPPGVPDRFQLTLGGMAAMFDTGAGLEKSTGAVSQMLVFEEFFGIPVHDQFLRFDGSWRIRGRHRLDAGYLNVSRTGTRAVESGFSFGDHLYQAGAVVTGTAASRFTYVAYRYDFVEQPTLRFSGTAGISFQQLFARVSASAGVTDQNGQAVTGESIDEERFSFPVPLIGAEVDWEFARHFMLETYSRFLAIDASSVRGGELDFSLHGFWYFDRHASVGLGYDKIGINWPLYVWQGDKARISYDIDALTLYLRGSF